MCTGEDISLLCRTLRLADFLGAEDLQVELAQSLADTCITVEAIHSVLSEGAANDELVARMDEALDATFASFGASGTFVWQFDLDLEDIASAPRRLAFALASQAGPLACLSEQLMATVASSILTPDELKTKVAGVSKVAKQAEAEAALVVLAESRPEAKALVLVRRGPNQCCSRRWKAVTQFVWSGCSALEQTQLSRFTGRLRADTPSALGAFWKPVPTRRRRTATGKRRRKRHTSMRKITQTTSAMKTFCTFS